MHQTTGRWKLGLALSLVTASMWGVLPIVLKILLGTFDAWTITFWRFLAASLLMVAVLGLRGTLPKLAVLGRNGWLLLLVSAVGLLGNYVIYLLGLNYITPGAAQIVIQLAPMLLLLGGVVFFGERFGRRQAFGLVVLLVGLGLFFNHRVAELLSGANNYLLGVLLIILAGVVWAAYALAQKQLLGKLGSPQIMLLLYLAGTLAFLPAAELGSLSGKSTLALALLAFASLNTLVAYGAFAEALSHWEASRVSAVLALAPLLTLVSMNVLARFSDVVDPEPLNALSWAGGLLVVTGSIMASLAERRTAPVVKQ